MGLLIACLREHLATLWTAEWFVNSVDFFMGLQIACLREHLAKLWTAKWFVKSVDFFMGLQIACLRECLATLWTAEWFVTSVDTFILYFIIVVKVKISASRAARGLKFWLQVALGPPFAP